MTDDGKVDWEEIQAMTPEQLDAELREAGADPVAVGDMGRAAAFLGKMVRFGWPGQMQHRELQALLAEVRQDERQRRERAIPNTFDEAHALLSEGLIAARAEIRTLRAAAKAVVDAFYEPEHPLWEALRKAVEGEK